MIGYVSRGLAGLMLGMLLMVASYQVGVQLAHADPLAPSLVAPGSAVAFSPAAATPADQLHDPLKDPGATFNDVKAAKKLGWPVLVLAVLLVIAKFGAPLAADVPKLAWLAQGKAAFVTAGFIAVAAAAYNALMLGGTWFAAALAAAFAGAALTHPITQPKPTDV